jgi:hypothetical protein
MNILTAAMLLQLGLTPASTSMGPSGRQIGAIDVDAFNGFGHVTTLILNSNQLTAPRGDIVSLGPRYRVTKVRTARRTSAGYEATW